MHFLAPGGKSLPHIDSPPLKWHHCALALVLNMTEIMDAGNLKSVAAVLHDARFTAEAIEFNATTNTAILKCWVPEVGGTSQQWKAFVLSFKNVTDCRINVKEKVRYYELATIKFSKTDLKLDLIAHYGIEISLFVDSLDATLSETSETRKTWE